MALEQGDLEDGLGAAAAVGDDTIQRRTQGRVVPDAFTHGTAEQRMRWFRRGYETGDPGQCDTFSARTQQAGFPSPWRGEGGLRSRSDGGGILSAPEAPGVSTRLTDTTTLTRRHPQPCPSPLQGEGRSPYPPNRLVKRMPMARGGSTEV